MDDWLDGDFAVMKIDLRNTFNLVSRQAVLNAVNLHFLELLSWCCGQCLNYGTLLVPLHLSLMSSRGPFAFLSGFTSGGLRHCY